MAKCKHNFIYIPKLKAFKIVIDKECLKCSFGKGVKHLEEKDLPQKILKKLFNKETGKPSYLCNNKNCKNIKILVGEYCQLHTKVKVKVIKEEE